MRKPSLREIAFRTVQQTNILLDELLPSRRMYSRSGRLNIGNKIFSRVSDFIGSSEFQSITMRFFEPLRDPKQACADFKTVFRDGQSRIIREARAVCSKRYSIMGRKDLSYGNPVDWHSDPLCGRKSPPVFFRRIDYLNPESVGDHKIVWELNRHQFFPLLGTAFRISGENRYLYEWISQTEHWIASNPPKFGINWASSLEIAFRSISWIWAWLFFGGSKIISEPFVRKYFFVLYAGAVHIERNLSLYFSPNTHLTGEALALVYLGLFFQGTPDADRWLNKGRDILLSRLPIHVREDGTYFEQSTYYHKYTTDFYLHLYILMRINGMPVPPLLSERLQKLLDFLARTQAPDGRTPLFGDDDGGSLNFMNNREYGDFRGALSTGAVLFNNAFYKDRAGAYDEETFWLLGRASREAFEALDAKPSAAGSVSFPDGGYFVMRNGWTRGSDFMMLDCGVHGGLSCGHAHSDLLSVVLHVGGKPLLIDPGTFTYTASRQWRDRFRSSQAHNTFSVDDKSQSLPAGAFSWKDIAHPAASYWSACADFDYFSGCAAIPHASAFHRRDVLFLKREGIWIITDRPSSEGGAEFTLHYHFPSDRVEMRSGRFIVSDETGIAGEIALFSAGPIKTSLIDDWYSPVYSVKRAAKAGACAILDGRSPVVSAASACVEDRRWESQITQSTLRISAREKGAETLCYALNRNHPCPVDIDGVLTDCESMLRTESGGVEKLLFFGATQAAVADAFKIKIDGRPDYIAVEKKMKSWEVVFSPASPCRAEALSDRIDLRVNGDTIEKGALCAASAASL
jgi:hypothetical protein